jgi:uncharacterized membrane protein
VQSWQIWAALAALFAAFTALLTKLGVEGIDAGLATWVRTLVVAVALTSPGSATTARCSSDLSLEWPHSTS